MSRYSPESGQRADPSEVLHTVFKELEKVGFTERAGNPRSLTWTERSNRQMAREKATEWNEPLLPGFGESGRAENAYDDCGNPHPFVCDSCGHHVDFGRTCGKSTCARCAIAWNRDYAIRKAAKVRRLRIEKHKNTSKNEHQKIHHQVISAPLGWYYDLFRKGKTLEEAQKITKKVVKKILQEQRAQGVVVRHSYRGDRDDFEDFDHTDDLGSWKERIYSQREFYGDVRDELAWMPHYHCVVVSDHLKGGEFTKKIEEETGWVVHRITKELDDGTTVSLENDGDMARALTYCLSHCDIVVSDNGNNRASVWEVGTFQGDRFRSSSRFTAQKHDLEWADGKVRECAGEVLGLNVEATTECGTTIPAVDDPDEMARSVIEQLYPDDDRRNDVDEDLVLHHVAEGNIGVEVSTTSGGGGSVSVTDAFGEPVGAGGWTGGGELPTPPKASVVEAASDTIEPVADPRLGDVDDEHGDSCSCGCDDRDNQDGDSDGDRECDGRLVPLEVARARGLLEDPEWCADAPHVDEAREADQEYPDDLEPWKTDAWKDDQAGDAIGVG